MASNKSNIKRQHHCNDITISYDRFVEYKKEEFKVM